MLGVALLVAMPVCIIAMVQRTLPPMRSLDDYAPRQSTRVTSHDGQRLGQFFSERRTVVPFDHIPRHVVHAFLAAEDAGFFAHDGIDWPGVVRAALKNLRPGAHLQGASTITQQTVKTLILGPERSYLRKLREALLARQMEQRLRKEEILALYLNQIYFGQGAWGVEEAARTYFDRGVGALNLAEAALLAAIPKNPARYNIRADPAAARMRAAWVLEQMQHRGWADPAAVQRALATPLPLPPAPSALARASGYYLEQVRRLLVERYGEARVLEGGLNVVVALQSDQQLAAYTALRTSIEDVARTQGYRGATRRVPVERLAAVIEALQKEFAAQVRQRQLFADANGADVHPFVWDLCHLTQDMAGDPATARCGVTLAPRVDYQRVCGLVTALDPGRHEAYVQLGSTAAVLPLRHMAWAHATRLLGRAAAPLRDPSEVLHVGDIVTVELMPPSRRLATAAPSPLDVALVPEPELEGALVAIEPYSRFVRALVGGYSPEGAGGFNRATQARRQPGSAFKPVLYAAALNGLRITPASICQDSPITVDDVGTGGRWRPDNFEQGRYDGNITYRTALARSKNICSVRLIQKVGVQPTLDMAHALGIGARLPHNLTLALGTGEMTVLELCRAYTTIASAGVDIAPRFIVSVADAEGQVLDAGDAEPDTLAMTPEAAYVLTSMLRSVVERGSGQRARMLARPMAGKTGTSQQSRDVWFAGFVPQLAATVWMGLDNNDSLGSQTGASAALPAWMRFMGAALAGAPPLDFAMPEHVHVVDIDPVTGLASEGPDCVPEVFVEGTAPDAQTQPLPSIYLLDTP